MVRKEQAIATTLCKELQASNWVYKQGCALRKFEGSPVLWNCKIQGAQHMICMKNQRFSSRPREEVRRQGPLGSARAQPWSNFAPDGTSDLLFWVVTCASRHICPLSKILMPSPPPSLLGSAWSLLLLLWIPVHFNCSYHMTKHEGREKR